MWIRAVDHLAVPVETAEAHLLSFGTVMVLCTWASALIGAAIAYLTLRDTPPRSMRRFLRFCFPSIILRHRSCRLDLFYVAISRMIHPVILAPFLITNVLVAEGAYAGLARVFGEQPEGAEPAWLWLVILVAAVALQDFMTFYVHYLEHRIPALWELHKVHHSAEFLLPITNRRLHPLQGIIDNLGVMVPMGILLGATSYAFALPVHDNSIIGVDAYFVLNILCFYHLRHSHIPMSYGQRLEWHALSPRQHQLHHSRAERHWDRNFGLCFAWWDRIFGTLYISDAYETYDLGLPADVQNDYDTVLGLFFTPLVKLSRMALGGRRLLPAAGVPVNVAEAKAAVTANAAMPGMSGLAADRIQAAD